MTDADKILSQHEVDALLSAIDSGVVEVGGEDGAAKVVMPYDFKRPERVAYDQLRAVATLHEVFARNMQAALSGQLRTIVDTRVASVDQLTFSEFINSLPNPTVFTVLSAEPLEGNFILEINPIIAFPIIERLLGSGRVGAIQPERSLTDIEWKLMDRIIGHILGLMKSVWSSVADISFRVTTKESNPQIMQILSANEPVISVVLELTLGEHKGYVNLCIPVMAIEGVMEKITSHTWFASRRKGEMPGQSGLITRSLAPAEVSVSAHLTIETIRFHDLKKLAVGDLLVTHHPQTAPLLISVEGKPKYVGRMGTLRDQMAFRVTGPIEPSKQPIVLQPRAELGICHAENPDSAASDEAHLGPILEIPLQATVLLAEKMVPLEQVLSLKQGDIIEFQKGVDEPLDLEISHRKLAQGIAVKRGEKFALQISKIQDPRETVRALGNHGGSA